MPFLLLYICVIIAIVYACMQWYCILHSIYLGGRHVAYMHLSLQEEACRPSPSGDAFLWCFFSFFISGIMIIVECNDLLFIDFELDR